MYTTTECDVAKLSPERTIIPSEMCSSDGSAGIMIPYGCVCYNGTTPGAQHFAVPSCMEDTHQLSNGSSLYRECLSNGKWSGTVARCEPIIPCEFNAVTQYQLQNNVCGLVFSLSIRFLSLKCNVHVGIVISSLT